MVLKDSDTPEISLIEEIAGKYAVEHEHLAQVKRLSVLLFDGLQKLHGLGQRERDLLQCAALLHDIGLSESVSRHHKHSMRLIYENEFPGFDKREIDVIAQVARYHRKAHPNPKHERYGKLDGETREIIDKLAAILRIADGLDRAHDNAVTGIKTQMYDQRDLTIVIHGSGNLEFAAWGAQRKSALFEEIYSVTLRFVIKEEQ